MAETVGIRQRAEEALGHHRQSDDDSAELSLLALVLEMMLEMDAFTARHVHLIERMEKHIMAADDAIFTDLTGMANDVAEMQTGIQNLLVQIQAGNTQGATDEATKIQTALDPLAASLRTAAAQFDTTPPVTPPDPNNPPVTDSQGVRGFQQGRGSHAQPKAADKGKK